MTPSPTSVGNNFRKSTSRFSLRARLILLGGVPLVGLGLGLIASSLGTGPVVRSIVVATTESAPLADLARTMQQEVLLIQDDFTDLGATRKQEELTEKFTDAKARRQTIAAGLGRFRTIAQRDGDIVTVQRIDEIGPARRHVGG